MGTWVHHYASQREMKLTSEDNGRSKERAMRDGGRHKHVVLRGSGTLSTTLRVRSPANVYDVSSSICCRREPPGGLRHGYRIHLGRWAHDNKTASFYCSWEIVPVVEERPPMPQVFRHHLAALFKTKPAVFLQDL